MFFFFVLNFLGLTNVFYASSRSSLFEVDVSMRVKANISNAIQYMIVNHTSKLMNARKEECNSCFNHDFKYLINNPDICKLTSGQTEI